LGEKSIADEDMQKVGRVFVYIERRVFSLRRSSTSWPNQLDAGGV
jgi:hypothetical protein